MPRLGELERSGGTIAKQVYRQWHEGSSDGVSRWVFVGQIAASVGFTLYSWLVRNWVFVATNSLMLLNGLAGYAIVLQHRRRGRARKDGSYRCALTGLPNAEQEQGRIGDSPFRSLEKELTAAANDA
jgi:hypothetical protein